MRLDHGAELVGEGVRKGIHAVVEHRNACNVDPVGRRHYLRLSAGNAVGHQIYRDLLQPLSSKQGHEGDLEPRSVLVLDLDRHGSYELEDHEIAEIGFCEGSELGERGVEVCLLRKQVDIPGGARVHGARQHALAAFEHERGVRLAEHAT